MADNVLARKRWQTFFALREFSERDDELEIYQIAGLCSKGRWTVTHYAQQRMYSLLRSLICAERGMSEAVHEAVNLAYVGAQVRENWPDIYDSIMEKRAKRLQ